jgi:hypothetical protein
MHFERNQETQEDKREPNPFGRDREADQDVFRREIPPFHGGAFERDFGEPDFADCGADEHNTGDGGAVFHHEGVE